MDNAQMDNAQQDNAQMCLGTHSLIPIRSFARDEMTNLWTWTGPQHLKSHSNMQLAKPGGEGEDTHVNGKEDVNLQER